MWPAGRLEDNYQESQEVEWFDLSQTAKPTSGQCKAFLLSLLLHHPRMVFQLPTKTLRMKNRHRGNNYGMPHAAEFIYFEESNCYQYGH